MGPTFLSSAVQEVLVVGGRPSADASTWISYRPKRLRTSLCHRCPLDRFRSLVPLRRLSLTYHFMQAVTILTSPGVRHARRSVYIWCGHQVASAVGGDAQKRPIAGQTKLRDVKWGPSTSVSRHACNPSSGFQEVESKPIERGRALIGSFAFRGASSTPTRRW